MMSRATCCRRHALGHWQRHPHRCGSRPSRQRHAPDGGMLLMRHDWPRDSAPRSSGDRTQSGPGFVSNAAWRNPSADALAEDSDDHSAGSVSHLRRADEGMVRCGPRDGTSPRCVGCFSLSDAAVARRGRRGLVGRGPHRQRSGVGPLARGRDGQQSLELA